MDARFAPYTKTLFSEASRLIVRDALDTQTEERLNTSVRSFLQLLSQYLLLRPAHKALEYLIRAYRVNEYNKDDLLHAALPYHATRTFGQLARLCLGRYAAGMARAQPYWSVLSGVRKRGAPVDRLTLAKFCGTPQGAPLLIAVAVHVHDAAKIGINCKAQVGFYAALVADVLRRLGAAPSGQFLLQLLPLVAAGLQCSHNPDYVAACLVIAAQISAVAQLTVAVQEGLIEAVCRAANEAGLPSLRRDAVRSTVVIFQTQETSTFPPRAAACMAGLPDLPGILASISGDGNKGSDWLSLGPFMGPLLSEFVGRCFSPASGDVGISTFRALLDLVNSTPMKAYAANISCEVLRLCAAGDVADVDCARTLMQALQAEYNDLVEQGVAEFADASSAAGSSLSMIDDTINTLVGGRHQLVSGTGTTLLLSLQHPASAVRLLGLRALRDCMADAKTGDEAQHSLIQDCVRMMLLQSEMVALALELPRLLEFAHAEQVLPILERILDESSSDARPEPAVLRALELLATVARAAQRSANEEQTQRCGRAIFASMLRSAAGSDALRQTLIHTATQVAHGFPLFNHMEVWAGSDGDSLAAAAEQESVPMSFARHLLTCAARSVVETGSDRDQRDGTTRRDCVQHARQLATDTSFPMPGRALALLALAVALNSLEQNHSVANVQRLCSTVVQLATSFVWRQSLRKEEAGETASCWDLQSVLPPKVVLLESMRIRPADKTVPAELLHFCVYSIVAHMPRVPADCIPEEIMPPPHLPGHMLGADAAPLTKSAATHEVPQEQSESSDPRLSVGTAVAMQVYRRSPRLNPSKRALEADSLDLSGNGTAAAKSAHGLDGSLQILASTFVLVTSAVQAHDGVPMVQAMLSRHFLSPLFPHGVRPVMRFLQLFWSSRFHTLTQLQSIQLSVAVLKATKQSADIASMTGRILVALQRSANKEVRSTLLALLQLLHDRGEAVLPTAIHNIIAKNSPSVLAATGHLLTVLTGALSPAADTTQTADETSGGDRLQALQSLTETSVDESKAICSINADLLSLVRGALSSWTSQRKASRPLLQPLRKFVAKHVSSPLVPPFELRRLVQMSFAVLSSATADAAGNLVLIEQVFRRSPLAESGGSVSAGWLRLLWDGALACVTAALVPAENHHMQTRVVNTLVEACERADSAGASGIHQALSRLPLCAQAVLGCLTKTKPRERHQAAADPMDALLGGDLKPSSRPSKSRKLFHQTTRSTGPGSQREREMVLLEMLQYKKDLTGDTAVLVPSLFAVLKAEIACDDGGDDYTKQLLLSSLESIAVVQHATVQPKSSIDAGASYDVPVLVDCLRTSTNPSTRNHTLLLLSAIATLSPHAVLTRVVPAITDPGVSMHVEDAYSMNVTQQILRAVVPPVVASGSGRAIYDLIQTVVDALPATPKHRRLPLCSGLVSVLNPSAYLHGVLLQLFEQQQTGDALFHSALAGSLCLECSAASQLTAFSNLVDVLSHGFEDGGRVQDVQYGYSDVVRSSFNDFQGMLHTIFSTATMKFVHQHLVDKRFLRGLLQDQDSSDAAGLRGAANYESACLRLFKGLLVYIRHVMELRRGLSRPAHDASHGKDAARQVYQLESTVFSCLTAARQLLSPAGFVEAITTLLAHRDHKVRNRVLQLLKEMLQQPSAIDHAEKTVSVLPTLKLLLSRPDSGSIEDGETETPQNKQLVLICIGMMCKTFGSVDSSAFGQVIRTVADAALHDNIQLVSSALLCLASLGAQFGPLLLPQLSLLVERICDSLDLGRDSGTRSRTTALLAISALTSLKVLVQNVARFLGPHIPIVLCQLLQEQLLRAPDGDQRVAEWSLVPPKVDDTLHLIASSSPARQLYVSLFETLDHAAQQGPNSLVAMLRTVKAALGAAKRSTIATHQRSALRFFVAVFEKLQLRDIDEGVEHVAVEAFEALVLKLSESEFKPAFIEIYEWSNLMGANADAAAAVGASHWSMEFADQHGIWRRAVIFYRVVKQLAAQLKTIFVPFYRHFIDALVKHLSCGHWDLENSRRKRKHNTPKTIPQEAAVAARRLVDAATDVAYLLFRYDSEREVATEGRLMEFIDPLASQLECSFGLPDPEYRSRIASTLTRCVSELAACGSSYDVWKPLNNALLKQSRSDRPAARASALVCVDGMFSRLSEEYLVLLPETIPFLAELMEDDNLEVEALVKRLVKRIEDLSGERLDQYL